MTGTQPRRLLTPVLYTTLLALQAIVGAMGLLGTWLLGHGQLEPGLSTTVIGYAVAVVAAATLGYVLLRLRPALPHAQPGETVGEYLGSGEKLGAATQVWILSGGSGLMCWFGLAMTGVWAPAAMGLVVLGAYLTLRPGALIKP